MFRDTIKKRVYRHINNRIEVAQQAHNEHVKELEAKAEEEHARIDDQLEESKDVAADRAVEGIIGKII